MIAFGSQVDEMQEIHLDQLFLLRLKLLIIMSKAFLEGYPIEGFRSCSIINNAKYIKNESTALGGLASKLPGGYQTSNAMDYGYVFYHRVHLLAIMAISIAEGNPINEHRKKALSRNLAMISQALAFNSDLSKIEFLKVA